MIRDMSQFVPMAKLLPYVVNAGNVFDFTWSIMYMQVAGDTHSLA